MTNQNAAVSFSVVVTFGQSFQDFPLSVVAIFMSISLFSLIWN